MPRIPTPAASTTRAATHRGSRRWARAIGLTLGFVLLWSLLSQTLGTLLTGRSWPKGPVAQVISLVALVLAALICVISTRILRARPDRAHRHIRPRDLSKSVSQITM
ncbi:hypothetical protein GCM10009673_08820 [Nesterenkonia sandarakina]